jgi:hypothetical protein
MTKRTIRCLSPALLAVAVLLLGTTTALAQAHTTGFDMDKECPTVVASGASYNCTVTISNNDDQHGVINLQLTNQFPWNDSEGCVGCGPILPVDCRQPFDPLNCESGDIVTELGVEGSPTAACGACLPETAPFNCESTSVAFQDEVSATGTDAAPPESPFFNLPLSSATTNATPVAPHVCDDNNLCTTDVCDPADPDGCVFTPTTCDDNNACTTDLCDPATGQCAFTPTVTCDDNNACTTDACDPATGECVFTPGPPCDDNNACTSDACDPATGECVFTPTVTCDDNNACTTDACDPATGECTFTPGPPCDDNNICTDDACDPATGECTFTPDPTNDPSCVDEEICRTPGFWGTHGGTEKEGRSTNITGTLLDAFNAANDPDLTVCGTLINNTTECSVNSALEAICISPKGDSRLQLGRQLTAAALNCIITNGGNGDECVPFADTAGAPCGGVSIEAVWNACNAACPTGVTADVDLDDDPTTPDVEVNCISLIDCFNNGHAIDTATGECTDDLTGCHELALDNGCEALSFQPPGAAGSPRECNDSRKNCVTIFGATDQCDDACVP